MYEREQKGCIRVIDGKKFVIGEKVISKRPMKGGVLLKDDDNKKNSHDDKTASDGKDIVDKN
jgi:hypothetical protein